MRLLLVGNYGVGNLGDEALKEYFLHTFSDVEWITLSAHPQHRGEVPRLPFGIRSFFKPWWRTLRAYRRSDGVVFGGGTLFTDTESLLACILWWWHAFVAWALRRPIYLAFQGIGPFRTRVGECCARWVVRRAALITVRDRLSRERVESWKLNKKIVQTFDPVYSLLQEEYSDIDAQNVLIVIPRRNSNIPFEAQLKSLLESRSWDAVNIITLQPEDAREQAVCARLQRAGAMEIKGVQTLEELMRAVAKGSCILSQRYHGALAGLALGKEVHCCPQREGDKLALLQEVISSKPSPQMLSDLVVHGECALREALKSTSI